MVVIPLTEDSFVVAKLVRASHHVIIRLFHISGYRDLQALLKSSPPGDVGFGG
jgi:hypothetical protein